MNRTALLSVAVLIAVVFAISNSMTRVEAQPPMSEADAEIATLAFSCQVVISGTSPTLNLGIGHSASSIINSVSGSVSFARVSFNGMFDLSACEGTSAPFASISRSFGCATGPASNYSSYYSAYENFDMVCTGTRKEVINVIYELASEMYAFAPATPN